MLQKDFYSNFAQFILLKYHLFEIDINIYSLFSMFGKQDFKMVESFDKNFEEEKKYYLIPLAYKLLEIFIEEGDMGSFMHDPLR